jgi:hypothetical protein
MKHGHDQKIKIVQWIDLECDADPQGNKKTIVRLFLAHFPMATELQLSLQKNAVLRAVNIHPIPGRFQLPSEFLHLLHASALP